MTQKSRILIVDDDPINVELLTAHLPSKEYEIIHSNGKEALQKVERELPDLILLEPMMPEFDGYGVVRRLKDNPQTSEIPVILITDLHETEDKIKGLESGADEFLNKPVDASELQARIKSLISLKQYEEQFQSRIQSEQIFSPLPAQSKSLQEKTILLVEDDELAVKLILNYLKNKPYNIEQMSNGIEAINRAKKGDIDLILLDLMLPGADGFEVCRHLREIAQLQHIQIIIITCLKDMESRIRGIELGVDDFLVKPINKEILIARIHALLKKKDYFDKLTSAYARALHSAMTDKLTGLYNHAYFKQFLQLEIERSLRQRHPLTLLLLDIDDFKQYNDTLGHLTGDEILREFGLVINRDTRKIDLAARYGGEEFAIILPYTDTEGAVMVANRIRQAIESYPFSYKPFFPSKTLTVSIGVASFQSDTQAMEDLIRHSDIALYQAKKEGKNRICVFNGTENSIT